MKTNARRRTEKGGQKKRIERDRRKRKRKKEREREEKKVRKKETRSF